MPTALVTGGNRGIGLEVCRGLAARGYDVLLASRDRAEGEGAASSIPGARAVPLDVTDRASIDALARDLAGSRLDALVINAGIALQGFDAGVVERTLAVNLFGALDSIEALVPLLGTGSRIVLVSSGLGELEGLAPAIRARFDPPRDRAAILEAARDFERAVQAGRETAEGWPRSAYRISKVALNALGRVLARELADRGVLVNVVCPGWVRTRMGGPSAPRSPEEGAAGIVWAATLPPGGPSGGFYRDARLLPW